jgi:ubiquinone/menaquinone biosynthesis C-methylase UbiE
MTEHPGLVFARVAEQYDRVRPGYPASLVDAACSIGELSPGSEVVEVGCGTGKLTAALVERGLRVDAVDPSPELLEIARDRTRESSVRFHLTRFEDVDLPEHAFAAVFSATAFHWVDPKVGWSKAARLLQPGGLLALLAYFGGSDIEVRARVHAAWREVLPEAANWRVRDEATIWEGANERLGNVSESGPGSNSATSRGRRRRSCLTMCALRSSPSSVKRPSQTCSPSSVRRPRTFGSTVAARGCWSAV